MTIPVFTLLSHTRRNILAKLELLPATLPNTRENGVADCGLHDPATNRPIPIPIPTPSVAAVPLAPGLPPRDPVTLRRVGVTPSPRIFCQRTEGVNQGVLVLP